MLRTNMSRTHIERSFSSVKLHQMIIILCFFIVLDLAFPLLSHADTNEQLSFAINKLSSCIQQQRTDPDLYMIRGLLYEKTDRFDDSLADLQTAKYLYLTAKAKVRASITMSAIDELKLRMTKRKTQ